MDFTIITPSLNYGHYLGECLQSVADQQGVSLEHLVLDGGSTDDSAGVASGFAHARFIRQADEGLSDAINKGFGLATGEWVMWLNADDRLKPGVLAPLLEALRGSSADIAYGDWDIIDREGRPVRHVKTPRWSRFIHVHHHCYVASTAAFYRRSTVIDAGHRLDPDFKYAMDGEFYARLDSAGLRFDKLALTIADFRMHGDNLSQRHLRASREAGPLLAAERQFAESRAIRRAHGITLFRDPYLNGLVDGLLWIIAKGCKGLLRLAS